MPDRLPELMDATSVVAVCRVVKKARIYVLSLFSLFNVLPLLGFRDAPVGACCVLYECDGLIFDWLYAIVPPRCFCLKNVLRYIVGFDGGNICAHSRIF